MDAHNSTTPGWIAALPGFNPANHYNHFTLAGQRWQHHQGGTTLYASLRSDDEPAGVYRQVSVKEAPDGHGFHWHNCLTFESPVGGDILLFARHEDRADSLQEAASLAADHNHRCCIVGGEIWYQAQDLLPGDATTARWKAHVGDETLEIHQISTGAWRWERRLDLSGFKRIGLELWQEHLTGTCDSAEAAMREIMAAPAMMRLACQQYLEATTPRPEPELIEFSLAKAA